MTARPLRLFRHVLVEPWPLWSCLAGLVASVAVVVSAIGPPQSAATTVPSDDEIRRLLEDRVDRLGGSQAGIGIVVGVIEPQGRRIVAYGTTGRADGRPPDANTVFEIGSVTKVFTALLLADMVRTGEVSLADPVARYLPQTAMVPQRKGRSITLVDLATHTSGLPFMPDPLPPLGATAAKYTATQIYEFLAHYELTRDIGAAWEYSNLGYWLLGEALAARAGRSFESLLQARVIAALGLTHTDFSMAKSSSDVRAVGHNAVLQTAPRFSSVPGYALMSSAGGLMSTANDLLTFLSTSIGDGRSPLATSMATMLSERRPAGANQQALGWVVSGGDDPLMVHDGGSFGFSSSVAWDRRQRVGVVVLSNQMAGVGDIARHLLRPGTPLEEPTATRRVEIALSPARAAAYVGRYEAKDEGVFVVARERGYLTMQPPPDWGLPSLHLRAEGRTQFFVAELPLRVVFQVGDDGRVTGVLVYPPRGQPPVLATKSQDDEVPR